MGVVGVIAEFLKETPLHPPTHSFRDNNLCRHSVQKKRQGAKLGHHKYHGLHCTLGVRYPTKVPLESTIQASAKIWPALAMAWPTAGHCCSPWTDGPVGLGMNATHLYSNWYLIWSILIQHQYACFCMHIIRISSIYLYILRQCLTHSQIIRIL